MIFNHKDAINFLIDDPEAKIDERTLIALHALLSNGLLPDQSEGGVLRKRPVRISGSTFEPLNSPSLKDGFDIFIQKANEIENPFEQAFFIMVHLPYLQPFVDVNKRVSRLAANIPFIQKNLCPLSFLDVPSEHYLEGILAVYEFNDISLLRDVYIWAYHRSCQQYTAAEQSLRAPNPLRLRYRKQLSEVISSIVREDAKPTESKVRMTIEEKIEPDDIEDFVQLVLDEFKTLHQSNAIRFGLREAEYVTWKHANGNRMMD